jgi:hypothetical protein
MVLPLKTVIFKLYEKGSAACRKVQPKCDDFPIFTRTENHGRIGGRTDSQKERKQVCIY